LNLEFSITGGIETMRLTHLSVSIGIVLACVSQEAKTETRWRGVNIAGAEFAAGRLPGRVNFDYHYPSVEELTDAARAGANIIRLPFLWERLQPVLGQSFDVAEFKSLEETVRSARALDLAVILDPHNYGEYRGNLIGTGEVTGEMFVGFWRQLVRRFPQDDGVIFGLMNEPHKHSAGDWAAITQAVVQAIRAEGSTQWILIPGSYWTGAHSWTTPIAGLSNADAFRHFFDPLNRFAFDMHQYFDADSSGTHRTCVNPEVGVERLKQAEAWLEAVDKKGFLGEFGASDDPVCLAALRRFIVALESHPVWIGWTYWAASSWFGDYMFNVFPFDRHEQGRILKDFLGHKPGSAPH
jgi:endoglucanase